MKLFDSFRSALQSIIVNKLRSALTMLGVIIGVASVIAMVAVGNGASIQVFDCLELPQQVWHWSGAELRTGINGRCLTIADANMFNGAALVLYDCKNGEAGQQWRQT